MRSCLCKSQPCLCIFISFPFSSKPIAVPSSTKPLLSLSQYCCIDVEAWCCSLSSSYCSMLIAAHLHLLYSLRLASLCGEPFNNNAPINCLPHYPPLEHWVGMGRDLTTPVINYPTLWAGEVIKSPPMTLVPHRGSCGI